MLETIQEKISDVWYELKRNSTEAILIGGLVLILLVAVAVLFQPTELVSISGNLVGKEYTPASSSVGFGSGVGSDGKPVTVVTTNHKSEEWRAILEIDGEYHTFEVSPKTFYALPDNSPVTLVCHRGKWVAYIKTCE